MNQKIRLILFSFIVGIPRAQAEITEIKSFACVHETMEQLNSEDLVIFDVDEVIFIAQDQILHPAFKKEARKLFKRIVEKKHGSAKAHEYWSTVLSSRKNKLVEVDILDVMRSLKEKHVPFIALTNASTGSYGHITKLEDQRIQDLKNLEVTMSPPQGRGDIHFMDMKLDSPGAIPAYKSGVLFTCGIDKGKILKKYIDLLPYKPKRIIFFDDKRSNLEDVEALCKTMGISFHGYEYTAVAHSPKITLDQKRAQIQYEVLVKESIWLSDDQVDAKLKTP